MRPEFPRRFRNPFLPVRRAPVRGHSCRMIPCQKGVLSMPQLKVVDENAGSHQDLFRGPGSNLVASWEMRALEPS